MNKDFNVKSFVEEYEKQMNDADKAKFLKSKLKTEKYMPLMLKNAQRLLETKHRTAIIQLMAMTWSQLPASAMLFVVGVSGMVTGVIWAVAGDMGGRAFSSTVVGVLDWAVYMGAAIQASVFGFVKDNFGWPAIFITIGCLYILMLVLTLAARKMKMKKL